MAKEQNYYMVGSQPMTATTMVWCSKSTSIDVDECAVTEVTTYARQLHNLTQ
jgi:hypothetical protein